MMSKESQCDLRIILVGKTGAGKSATGNTILGQDVFKSELSSDSITKNCQIQHQINGDRRMSVIDTPGTFGSSKAKKTTDQIKKCVEMSVPGPHAFLLVIRIGRFTEEEKNTVKWIQETFGEDVSMYTIVLFTHADQLKGKPLNEFIRENRDLHLLINTYGNRYLAFNNEERNDRNQVTELQEEIDSMVRFNGGQYYTNEMFQKAPSNKNVKKFLTFLLGAVALVCGVEISGVGAVLAAKAAVAVQVVARVAGLAAKIVTALPLPTESALAVVAGIAAVVIASGTILHNVNYNDN